MNIPLNFWNDMARRYPSFDDPAMSEDVMQMIRNCEAYGINFRGRRVLDIGCGTGTVAIPLALRGAEVTAVDICEPMLRTCRDDAKRAGVEARVRTVCSDWEGFRVDAPYDIVIASMTPAISGEAGQEKLLRSATEAGVYVGWGSYRINRTVKHLFEAHGADYPMLFGQAARFTQWLQGRGIEPAVTYFSTAWEECMSSGEAEEYARSQLRQHEIAPDDTMLESVLGMYRRGDVVAFHTDAEKGVVAWRNRPFGSL